MSEARDGSFSQRKHSITITLALMEMANYRMRKLQERFEDGSGVRRDTARIFNLSISSPSFRSGRPVRECASTSRVGTKLHVTSWIPRIGVHVKSWSEYLLLALAFYLELVPVLRRIKIPRALQRDTQAKIQWFIWKCRDSGRWD
eukprot:scaffold21422_cov103-Skeletonema_dohrnii-CCMP3373.AAC.2